MEKFHVLKKPVIFSVLLHISLGLLFFLTIPQEAKEGRKPFIARIITPEEMEERQVVPGRSGAGLHPVPRPPGQDLRQNPRPSRQAGPVAPQREPRPVQPPASQQGTAETPPESAIPSPPGRAASPGGQPGGSAAPPAATSKSGDQKRIAPDQSLRERLFDRGVIEQFAKKEETKRDTGITFETEEFRYHTYMMRLKERIEGIWKYPPDAAMRGIYGDLYIQFTIRKNGTIGALELLRTSGHRSLDEAAQQALKDAQPFWPLPDEWGKESLTITGHFVYSIYGTYIR